MSENIKTLKNQKNQAFQPDRDKTNYSQKISPEEVAVTKTKRAYDWMEKTGVKELFSQILRQYLITMGYRVSNDVADPYLSFRASRNLKTEYTNVNGNRIFTGTSMDIDNGNNVRINPELSKADDPYVIGSVGNELGHACASEYTGISVENHERLGWESLFQTVLYSSIIIAIKNNKLAEKAYSATKYTR